MYRYFMIYLICKIVVIIRVLGGVRADAGNFLPLQYTITYCTYALASMAARTVSLKIIIIMIKTSAIPLRHDARFFHDVDLETLWFFR